MPGKISTNRLKCLLIIFSLSILLFVASLYLNLRIYNVWSPYIKINFTQLYHDRQLKQIILDECPELQSENTTDYQKVSILRTWAANIIDCSDYDLLLNKRPAYFLLSAYEIYQFFNQNEGGVWCDGAAVFFRKVLRLFDFEAYELAYGSREPGGLTHTVTLVTIQEGESEVLSVQDAYFNTTYELSAGKPLDYFDLLRLLKDKRANEVVLVEPTPPLTREVHRIIGFEGDNYEIETTRSLFTFYTVIGNNTEWMSRIYAFLERNHYPQNEIYLNLFPFYCSGSEEILEKARGIVEFVPLKYD